MPASTCAPTPPPCPEDEAWAAADTGDRAGAPKPLQRSPVALRAEGAAAVLGETELAKTLCPAWWLTPAVAPLARAASAGDPKALPPLALLVPPPLALPAPLGALEPEPDEPAPLERGAAARERGAAARRCPPLVVPEALEEPAPLVDPEALEPAPAWPAEAWLGAVAGAAAAGAPLEGAPAPAPAAGAGLGPPPPPPPEGEGGGVEGGGAAGVCGVPKSGAVHAQAMLTPPKAVAATTSAATQRPRARPPIRKPTSPLGTLTLLAKPEKVCGSLTAFPRRCHPGATCADLRPIPPGAPTPRGARRIAFAG